MTIENGLDTPATTELDRMLEAGELDERTTAYLTLTRSQSIGWMLHDKAVCNYLRVSAFILRKIKAAVAKLPGIRRVRYISHKGVEYDGLLLGDHAEGEGYGIAGWYDGKTYVPGPPPMLVQPPEIKTFDPTPDSFPPRAPRRRWSKRPGRKKNIPEAQVVAVEEQVQPEDRVTSRNSERRCELMELAQRRPDLAPFIAVLDGMLDHKNVPTGALFVETKAHEFHGLVGEFTQEQSYAAVEATAQRGTPTLDAVASELSIIKRKKVMA